MIITVASFKGGETLIERGIPGIYSIRNTENDKRYIGSAISVYDRLYNHIWHLEQGTHRNQRLLNAWRKYGISAFVFEVIETISDPLQLLDCEQHWIDHYDCHRKGYNINPKAGSNLGREFDSEVRRNMANAARQAMSDPEVKERHRLATRLAMSRPEVREKCRQAMLRRHANPTDRQKYLESIRSSEARAKKSQNIARARALMPPELRRQIAIDAAARQYQVQWPDGKVETITNLKSFCQQHSLPYDSAISVLKGRMKAVRGVMIRKKVPPLS